jgi:PKD repeat protein
MKKFYKTLLAVTFLHLFLLSATSQVVEYQDTWGSSGITLKSQTQSGITVNYSISNFFIGDLNYNRETFKTLNLPGVFLPNDAGAPNLPGLSKYIAIPQGAEATLTIVNSRTEIIENFELAPAPNIPLDTDNKPLEYIRDEEIYSKDEFYPENPIKLSEKTSIRGLDVVMLGITPFQYNPVTKELIVLRDIEIEISFVGGNGHFGEDRLRSKWWDPMVLKSVLNPQHLTEIDYSKRISNSRSLDYEYLIISPDDPDFLSWADSIKQFRTLQGIRTGVVTISEIGGNTVSAIESYVDNAYNTWDIPPVAVLLMADYGTGSSGIISQFYNHPAGYPDFVSDIKYSDVDGDDLPDIVFARITANNEAQLEVMVSKFLDYERNPPTDPDFYNHPITALGWQTERWFQICSEVVGGYFSNALGKDPVRINAVYGGNPNSDPWSTATNTSTVLNYFGPSGLGYIPATPQELGGFSGGTASDVVNAINDGSFLLQHRDHGSYSGWGEPDFTSSNINSLTNTDNKLPYIFSINCQTGAFHRSSESFTEKFHRHTYNGENSGALGVLAATEVSYSFVNDTYLWGVMDNMFPDFMPAQNAMFPVNYTMPAFGNAAGKHFLFSSSWPYNTGNKLITYRLFHHHGDAFLTLYTEVPQHLDVDHEDVLFAGATSFTVDVNDGAFIALTLNGEILATAESDGAPLDIDIPAQVPGSELILTITKQNYFRYSSLITVVPDGVYAQFVCEDTDLCAGNEAIFVDQSFGSNTSWEWQFEGGTPATYSGQTPPPIVYETPGVYDVILTVSDGIETDSKTRTDYITVLNNVFADFDADITTGYSPLTIHFTDLSSNDVESWEWDFGNGGFSGLQNPTYSYYQAGTYTVSLTVEGNGCENTETKVDFIVVEVTAPVVDFSAIPSSGTVPLTVNFNDDSEGDIETWHWDFGDGNSSDEQHPEHTFMDADDYTITLTVTGPGGTETLTKEDFIDVRDILSLTVSAASEQVCLGESTQLFAEASGGTEAYTFNWTSEPAGFVSDEQNPIITPDETTVYIVELNDGEETLEGEVEIIVHTLPEITLGEWPEVLCIEEEPPVQLTAMPEGGVYTGLNVSEDGIFTPEEATVGYNVITYTYEDENGCVNSLQDSIYVDQCVGINDKLSENTIHIYPNPNQGEFTVSCNSVIERIWIINQKGETVFDEMSDAVTVRVNTDLSKGVYFLRIITSDNTEAISKKIIIR